MADVEVKVVTDEATVKVDTDEATVKVGEDVPMEPVKAENAFVTVKLEDLPKPQQEIIRQVEYYFGDINLQRDKFMLEKIDPVKNPEGWIDISVLLTFNRLKKLTEDATVIAAAMANSPHGLVELSEDKLRLRRHPENPRPELNETRRKDLMSRTAYAKGFPLEAQLAEIIEYFQSNFENVEHTVMRKYFVHATQEHKFKGSVFVTFKTKEQAEAFVVQPDVKYLEKDLLRDMQAKYIERKREEREEQAKKKKAKVEALKAENDKPLPKGALLHFEVAAEENEITREDIKDCISKVEPKVDVAFISFQKGEKQGDLRFNKENDGKTLLETLEEGKVS